MATLGLKRDTAVSELAAHYRERELEPDTIGKHIRRITYEGYLNKWNTTALGNIHLSASNAGELSFG